ncbi:hypothetical protein OUZ56_033439 [Daphnia magna]|uniref:Uncharacterized protein n=1 Tax=Daphnia magna TaxID=35525 RepID=A0ABQ9ZYQ9_9CRUS|nr:hypothetical protein OUZ56_033439 [Daphnia magna]
MLDPRRHPWLVLATPSVSNALICDWIVSWKHLSAAVSAMSFTGCSVANLWVWASIRTSGLPYIAFSRFTATVCSVALILQSDHAFDLGIELCTGRVYLYDVVLLDVVDPASDVALDGPPGRFVRWGACLCCCLLEVSASSSECSASCVLSAVPLAVVVGEWMLQVLIAAPLPLLLESESGVTSGGSAKFWLDPSSPNRLRNAVFCLLREKKEKGFFLWNSAVAYLPTHSKFLEERHILYLSTTRRHS